MLFEDNVRRLKGPILVLGASGFIGANLLKMILVVRQDVFGCVRKKKGARLSDVDDANICIMDINDPQSIQHALDRLKPQTVLDCSSYGAYSFEEDVGAIYETNVLAIVELVTRLQKLPLAAYVHAGSSSEYGTNCSGPRETDKPDPNSHYAVSKLAAATFLEYMGKHRGAPCVNLRLYSIYGPLEDTSRLIPNVLRKAIGGELPPFVDAATSRDFLYVEDACAAFVAAAVEMRPEIYGESFNIGSGTKTTIGELAYRVRDMFAIEGEPQFGTMPGRKWDLAEWYSNPEKANRLLGWQPTYSLEAGLRKTAEWVSALSEEGFQAQTKKTALASGKSISAIIACYKDAEAIPFMHRRLTSTFNELGIDYEIIFVNDCSPDNSEDVIREISADDPHVIGISHSRNFGSQMAFRSGMEIASKDGVVLLDGDLQDPPEMIAKFYPHWEEGYDVVYGRRIKREMPAHWELLYRLFYRLLATFSYIKIPVDAGDFSLIDRRVAEWMLNCNERDLFMRGIRAYVGFRQIGVDYVRPERMFGRSTNNFIRNVEWAKKGIFSFSDAPLKFLTYSGAVLLLISAIIALIQIVLKIFVPEIAPKGVTTLLLAILGFGSVNLFSIGIVGEYIAKIMSEVKARPQLIRVALIKNGKATLLRAADKLR